MIVKYKNKTFYLFKESKDFQQYFGYFLKIFEIEKKVVYSIFKKRRQRNPLKFI